MVMRMAKGKLFKNIRKLNKVKILILTLNQLKPII